MKLPRSGRDIFLILLTIVIVSLGQTAPNLVKNWTPITTPIYLVAFVALILLIWIIIIGIRRIDDKDESRLKDETKKLIKDTVKETLENLGINNKH